MHLQNKRILVQFALVTPLVLTDEARRRTVYTMGVAGVISISVLDGHEFQRFFFIFFIFVFYKNIFLIWKFTGIYPGRPAAGRPGPGRTAAGRQGHF